MTGTSKTEELPTVLDPSTIQSRWFERWTRDGVFTANPELVADRQKFVVMIPPPNVTAVLHMGHGLNNTVQDVIVRWRRMVGDETLWVPGTDHAGIATQNIVERLVKREEGKTRFDLGRDAFVKRTQEFVEETGGSILNQLKAIGASADWSRTAYTLSPALSKAVREAFVRLHEDGLVYRGKRVIHWCPRCGTSLSDEEAEFRDSKGALYHLFYPLAEDPSKGITVATTRPETMLGDVAVAVNPSDKRYSDLIGKELVMPINGFRIPVIADDYTDPEFGSGAVKITPAHDANDFEVGRRHGLAMPVVINAEGFIADVSEAAGRVPDSLNGLDRDAARKLIVQLLQESGNLIKTEAHDHSVRHCYRCDTVVEPRLSDQWFVRMQPLADKALDALRSGRLRILPDRWEAVYVNWLEGTRDWNISRQLWWGHRIPVWYCDSCGTPPIASREDISVCPSCGAAARQDEDVLDTWFSSWLWPFSTLGWPDENSIDLKAFYPTDVLVTAPEILFFWVARMVMAGEWFLNKTPFHTVYLHGTVRDMQHRKMSKSLGNGIDPLDVVRDYGADALRWTVIAGSGMGVDLMLDPEDMDRSFAPGRNFCTKLWNIGKFLLSRVGSEPVLMLSDIPLDQLTPADQWILDRLDEAIEDCNTAFGPARPQDGIWQKEERFKGLRLSEYSEAARRFVWNELADWYLESVKPRLASGGSDAEVARAVLSHSFDAALRLLHPVIPFITEELWQRIPLPRPSAYCANAPWPEKRTEHVTLGTGNAFEIIRLGVTALRQVRADYQVPPGQRVEVVLTVPAERIPLMESLSHVSGSMARASFSVCEQAPEGAAARAVLAEGYELVVPLSGMIDPEKERTRISTEIAQLSKQLSALEGRLSNEAFVSKAPAHIVEAERVKASEWKSRLSALNEQLSMLESK